MRKCQQKCKLCESWVSAVVFTDTSAGSTMYVSHGRHAAAVRNVITVLGERSAYPIVRQQLGKG